MEDIFLKIEVTAVKHEEKEILLNLMEKYEYELSQYYHYNEVNELDFMTSAMPTTLIASITKTQRDGFSLSKQMVNWRVLL